MQTLCRCAICQQDLPLDNFLFLLCGSYPLYRTVLLKETGHGFCQGCIQSYYQSLCPICKQTIVGGGHRIYIHSPDSVASVGDAISAMKHGLRVRSCRSTIGSYTKSCRSQWQFRYPGILSLSQKLTRTHHDNLPEPTP